MVQMIFTTDQVPAGMEIKETFSMIQYTGVVEVTAKGPIRGWLEKDRNEYQEIIERFMRVAPRKANAIAGVQVSTTSESFSNGCFLFMTYIGTPVIIGKID